MKKVFGKLGGFPFLLVCLLLLCGGVGYKNSQLAAAERIKSCPNCGMMLKEWAHTNHEFTSSEGHFRVCSIYCLADMSNKSGEIPQYVSVADYLHPDKMIPVGKALYVIGSSAPGTMTKISKLAFESRAEAENFANEKGGRIDNFSAAFAATAEELPMSKPMIEEKRIKMGKIALPTAQDRCEVCNMMPVKYPKHNAQLLTADKKRFQFCSTKCLFSFLDAPQKDGAGVIKVEAVWVHDYASGRYIYGPNGYYVVGAKVFGPMGPQTIPFDLKADAKTFARENGGTVLRFNEVKSAKIGAK